MFRTLVIVLALAAYGAYSLVSSLWADAPPPETPVAVEKAAAPSAAKTSASMFSLAGAADLAATAASKAAGLGLQDMPDEGCSDSMMSPHQVMDLLNRLPDAQRIALAKAMQASSTLWTAQLYRGELGIGMCLPTQGKLLRLPIDTDFSNVLPATAGEAAETIRSLVDAVKPAI